ncbi:VacJ family lipoprotein [Sphingomonas mollis]|uniref:MlaA family lipoprotein n=1 Tax=Sphingomonas mollis TaxID=2795726 RepID=UPI002FCE18D9
MLAWTTALLLATNPVVQEVVPVDPAAAAPADAQAVPPSTPPAVTPVSPPVPTQIPTPVAPPPPVPANAPVDAVHNDIVVTARARWEAPDPFADVNAESFAVTQKIDNAVMGPAALAYKKKVPGPVRRGIHNFLYNLREPVVFVNFVLQHKIGKAAETVGRFAINTTIGAIGLFDVAKKKPFRLPRRSNGFANTLGFYGVPNGPFMFLPIVGPTTVRDLFGGAIDRIVLPVTLGQGVTDPKFAIPAGVLGALDHRAEFDETLKRLHDGAADPYANSRDFYLQRRQAEIDLLKGRGKGNGGPLSDPPKGPIILKPRTGASPVVLPPATPVEPVPSLR